ncbi:uncharacterized protein LOC126979682 isoform X4 [Leptidea sinapis]|nr:uncharacterized protein LOC126979682 isoform X4 [Leptidea sinapis]
MQDTFMSDSEDEGGEVECPIQQQQQYRYMNSEAGTLNRAKPLEDSVTDGHLWPSNNDSKVATMERQPVDIGFLVSFVVDARGGAMKAKRRGGVRVIVPAAACAAPTRLTCRAATRRAPAAAPPPLMEGEALASRLLELQPQGAKFLAPVIIEVPIFTASCPEREIVILRSDSGETWQDHYLHNNDNPMIQEALYRERQEHGPTGESLGENGERVTRIITCDFPHYLAVVSRIRQEVHIIGPEGGTISSAHIPQVQALFPPDALTKRIRVGLQAHGAPPELCRRLLPRHAAVSAVLTVEPRRRKFHRTITLTAPLPRAADQKVTDKSSTSSLRLLCSIMGGQARAVWEDVTGSTPLTITSDCASFTTTVSARFWLMNYQNVSDATKLATELYREMLIVPFDVRIVVLGKRLDALEGRLLVMYITDRYAYDTLLRQEHYTEVAHSTAVRFLDGKEIHLEFSGNLVPVTKSGSQPAFKFEAFKDNRVEFTVRVKHHEESPSGRIYFMNEPKVAKGEQSQSPVCVLDVELPQSIAPRAGKSHADCLNLDQSGFDALNDELSFHWGDHNNSGPPSLHTHHEKSAITNGHDKTIVNGNVKFNSKDTVDTDKSQVNGDTLNFDSNKVKATFDSDEDKTPMNTLEKGKKKPEGGFLGGLAGKVKNVFSSSEENDDSRESSPMPQPKPRESKDKSPPKPAPRIINEDLLEKVDDMFKDLKEKPHTKEDEDVHSKVYLTKLIVDEDHPDLKEKTEELYHQYEHMQPVETPLHCKISDPFQLYTGCCEHRYKKGEKHRHDETSNLNDIIEQVKFTTNETIQEISERPQNAYKDESDKLEKEKDISHQKSLKILDNATVIENNIKDDIVIEISNQADSDDIVADIKSQAEAELDHIQSAAQDIVSNLLKSNINNVDHKVLVMDFLAAEQAEASKTFDGKDTRKNLENTVLHVQGDVSQKANEKVSELKEGVSNIANGLKNNIKAKVEDVEVAMNEKENDLSYSIEQSKGKLGKGSDNIKSKVKEGKVEGKKKSKEGKNFFTGLVHNIFGDKDKVDEVVKDKVSEGKKSGNKLSKQLSSAKDSTEENLTKQKEVCVSFLDSENQKLQSHTKDVVDEANKLLQNAKDTSVEVQQTAQNKSNQILQDVENKKIEMAEQLQKTKDNAVQSIENNTINLLNEVEDEEEHFAQNVHKQAQKLIADVESTSKEVTENILNAKDNIEHSLENKHIQVSVDAQRMEDQVNDTENTLHEEAKNMTQNILNNKENILHNVLNTKENAENEALQNTEQIVRDIKYKRDEAIQSAQNKRDELVNSLETTQEVLSSEITNKADEATKALEDTKLVVEKVLESKNVDFQETRDLVVNAATDHMDRIRQEAEIATDEIKKEAEKSLNIMAIKKAEIQDSVTDKVVSLGEVGMEKIDKIKKTAFETTDDAKDTAKHAYDHTKESSLNAFDTLETAAKDKVTDAKNTWSDLHSSARDTYADMTDDVHCLESGAQDTLQSFQSSAGNTFDSLEDSTREVVDGVETTITKVDAHTKELFGAAKDSFEGFSVTAENKLEDIKLGTSDKIDEAGDRLDKARIVISECANATTKNIEEGVSREADKFASNLNDLGNSVFGISGKGFIKDSSSKLLESEKSQSSPHKKGSGIPKLKKKKK